jgi:uncharacterized membrane protein YfcA
MDARGQGRADPNPTTKDLPHIIRASRWRTDKMRGYTYSEYAAPRDLLSSHVNLASSFMQWLLIPAGVAIGALGTLIGVGGGFLLIPLLIYLYDYPPAIVTGISLTVVLGASMSGSIAYARLRRTDYYSALLFAAAALPGAMLGTYASHFIPKALFHGVFGAFLSAAAGWIWLSQRAAGDATAPRTTRGHRRALTDADGISYEYAYSRRLGVGISAAVGFAGSLLGVGGGIILVPSFVRWLNFPPKVATATSQLMVMIYALSGVALRLSIGSLRGYVDEASMLLVGAVVGAQIGARLSRRLRGKALLRMLAVAVGVVGLQLVLRAFAG